MKNPSFKIVSSVIVTATICAALINFVPPSSHADAPDVRIVEYDILRIDLLPDADLARIKALNERARQGWRVKATQGVMIILERER
jgi:hypothetical protein